MFSLLSVLQGCVFILPLLIMQPWFYPVVKYCFNTICFTRFSFVNSVIVSIISCNDLYQDFFIMYVWYFVSRNSISVLGAIRPSLSPCTVINPILLTYLLICTRIVNYKNSIEVIACYLKRIHMFNKPTSWILLRHVERIDVYFFHPSGI